MHTSDRALLSMLRLAFTNQSPTPPSTDRRPDEFADLAKAAASGDRSARHALLLALAPHLLRGVRSVLGPDSSDLDDVAQEAALVLLRALPSFRGDSSVARFARGTAVLVALNERRRLLAEKRGRWVQPEDSDPDCLPTDGADPEERARGVEAANAVRRLLLSLPPPQAETLALQCLAGCTLSEIGATMRVTVDTVKSRLRLARRALRRSLAATPQLLELLEDE